MADLVRAPFTIFLINAPGIGSRHALRGNGSRFERKGLGGGGCFAGHAALRNWAFFHAEYRLSGFTVQDEKIRCLGANRNGGNRLTVALQIEQERRRSNIIIPKIMVNRLKVPDELSRVRSQRNNGIRKQIIAEPFASVIIRARAAGRNKY